MELFDVLPPTLGERMQRTITQLRDMLSHVVLHRVKNGWIVHIPSIAFETVTGETGIH